MNMYMVNLDDGKHPELLRAVRKGELLRDVKVCSEPEQMLAVLRAADAFIVYYVAKPGRRDRVGELPKKCHPPVDQRDVG